MFFVKMVKYGRRRVRKSRARRRAPVRRKLRTVKRRKLQAGKTLINAARGAATLYSLYQGGKGYSTAINEGSTSAGKRKRTTGSRTQTKRLRRRDSGTGAYSQWSQRYTQAKFGRLTNKKLIRDNMEYTTFKWTNLKRFGGQGAYLLGHYIGADTNLYLPCILIELNSVNNFVNGSVVPYAPVRHLYKTVTNGNYGFVPINGFTATGGTSTDWQVERSSHLLSNPQAYPNDSSIWKWCSMEFEFWGMKNYPTKWMIQLVQLNEDVTPLSGVAIANPVNDNNAEEFWDSMIKPYSFSPLVHQKAGYGKKKWRVLKQYSINIDPTASFENDASPHCKTFKIFYRMNRKCQFDWKYANSAGQDQADLESVKWQVEDQENQVQVHPNARMYLLLRASNFEQQANLAACTSANTPSFTAVIRNCHIVNS